MSRWRVPRARWRGCGQSLKDDCKGRRGEEGTDPKATVESFAADEELAESFDGCVSGSNGVCRWCADCSVFACYDRSEQFEDGKVVDRTGCTGLAVAANAMLHPAQRKLLQKMAQRRIYRQRWRENHLLEQDMLL